VDYTPVCGAGWGYCFYFKLTSVSLFHVQQLMEHSSPFVTQIYAHLGTAELMSSVEKLDIQIPA